MRVSEVARVWGVSLSYVSRLAKQGMPLGSLAEADSWRIANLKKPPRSSAGSAIVTTSKAKNLTGQPRDETSPAGLLQRAQKVELDAFALFEEIAKGGNAIALRSAIHAHGEASRRCREAELAHHQYLLATGEMMTAEEVRQGLARYFTMLRALLDALPHSTCTKANPADPECARIALQDSVSHILRAIAQAEEQADKDFPSREPLQKVSP